MHLCNINNKINIYFTLYQKLGTMYHSQLQVRILHTWPMMQPVTLSKLSLHCQQSFHLWQEDMCDIQVLDPAELMILRWTALYLAEERPLLHRILAAGGHMLSHGLLDLEGLATVMTQEHLIWCWPVQTMDSSGVLHQTLFGGIVLVTLMVIWVPETLGAALSHAPSASSGWPTAYYSSHKETAQPRCTSMHFLRW